MIKAWFRRRFHRQRLAHQRFVRYVFVIATAILLAAGGIATFWMKSCGDARRTDVELKSRGGVKGSAADQWAQTGSLPKLVLAPPKGIIVKLPSSTSPLQFAASSTVGLSKTDEGKPIFSAITSRLNKLDPKKAAFLETKYQLSRYRLYQLEGSSSEAAIQEAVMTWREQNIFAVPNYARRPFGETGRSFDWPATTIRLPEALAVTQGDPNTRIAILDTGIDIDDVSLMSKVDLEHSGRFLAGEFTSALDDIEVIRDTYPNRHGATIASIISQTCPQCRFVILNVWAGWDDLFYDGDILFALMQLAQWQTEGTPIQIVHMGFGSPAYSGVYVPALAELLSQGTAAVASAGGPGTPEMIFPAAFAGVFAVMATDVNDAYVRVGSYGRWVDIAAPGYITGGLAGTSMASSYVAGLAGLVQPRVPTPPAPLKKSDAILGQIRATAEPIDSKNFAEYRTKLGAGRIDAYRAVTSQVPRFALSRFSFTEEVGDGNLIPDQGETILIKPILKNLSPYSASTVTVRLLNKDPDTGASDPMISMSQGSGGESDPYVFNGFAGLAELPVPEGPTQLQIHIDSQKPAYEAIHLTLKLTYGTDVIQEFPIRLAANRNVGRLVKECGDKVTYQDLLSAKVCSNQETPVLDEAHVAWKDDRNLLRDEYGIPLDKNYDIYASDFGYTFESNLTLSGGRGEQRNPAIYGRVVWEDKGGQSPSNDLYDIYMSTVSPVNPVAVINTQGLYHKSPSISGNRVIWVDKRSGQWNLYTRTILSDGSFGPEGKLLKDQTAEILSPSIWKGWILWSDDHAYGQMKGYWCGCCRGTMCFPPIGQSIVPYYYYSPFNFPQYHMAHDGSVSVWDNGISGASTDVFLYDSSLNETSKLTSAASGEANDSPKIVGSRVIWQQLKNQTADVMMKDLMIDPTTSINLSTSISTSQSGGPYGAKTPAIYNNRVVWSDWRNDNWDVYTANLSQMPTLIITMPSRYYYTVQSTSSFFVSATATCPSGVPESVLVSICDPDMNHCTADQPAVYNLPQPLGCVQKWCYRVPVGVVAPNSGYYARVKLTCAFRPVITKKQAFETERPYRIEY